MIRRRIKFWGSVSLAATGLFSATPAPAGILSDDGPISFLQPPAQAVHGNATFGAFGSDEGFQGSFEALAPLLFDGRQLLFLYPEFTTNDHGEQHYSIGLGYRILLDRPDLVLGANIFYDNGESPYDNRIHRLGLGGEVLGRRFSARINYYFADGDEHLIDSRTLSSNSTSSRVVGRSTRPGAIVRSGAGTFQSFTTTTRIRTTTTTTSRTFERFEKGMDGLDAEFGVQVPLPDHLRRAPDIWLYAGYYDFDNDYGDDLSGFKARAEFRFGERLTFDAAYYEDDGLIGSHWFGGVRVHIPFGGGYERPAGLHSAKGTVMASAAPYTGGGSRDRRLGRLTENIIRDPVVRTAQSGFIENPDLRRVTRRSTTTTRVSESLRQIEVVPGFDNVIFVDGANSQTGDGSFDNPFQNITLAQAEAESRAAGSGEAQTIYVFNFERGYNEAVTFDGSAVGNFVVNLLDSSNPITFNGTPIGGLDPRSNWTAPGLQVPLVLTNLQQFALQGFEISSRGADALVAQNVGRLFINDTGLDASEGGALNLTGVTRVVGNNVGLTSRGGPSGIRIENSGGPNPSSLNFRNGAIADSTGPGVLLNNNTGTYQFGGLAIENGAAAGIDILGGSNGTFTFTDTSITDPGGPGVRVDGGLADVTFGGGSSITQGNPAAGIDILGGHAGTFTFGPGTTITANDGSGLQFDNADGTYNFNGGITLGGGDAGIDILGGSNGTFTFGANTSITDPGGTAFNIADSSPNVTYRGTISDNGGRPLSIVNTAGGTIRFIDGSITNTGGLGINVANSLSNITVENARILNSTVTGVIVMRNDGTFRFSNGTIDGSAATGFSIVEGGGTVDIIDSTISGNGGVPVGGGIYDNSSGTTNVTNSTISGNEAGLGGGIAAEGDGTLNIFNSTVANNSAGLGGGIFNDWAGFSGGTRSNDATINLTSSIVAGNNATSAGPDIDGEVNANSSLIGDTSGVTISGTDNVLNQNPLLAPLADNGGDTLTHALDPNSPAVNAGSNPLFLADDQRGLNRLAGGQADIGAFELQVGTLVANDDFYLGPDGAIGNVLFAVPNAADGIFNNDDPFTTFTTPNMTANGGNLNVNGDGTFTYNPPAGFTGANDSFNYEIRNGPLSAMATVAIGVSDLVWFIDDTAAPGGDGRQTSPFDSLGAVGTGTGNLDNTTDPDGRGDAIFVRQGAGPYDGGIFLERDQRLFGQGAPLVLLGRTVEGGSPAQTPTVTNTGTGAGITLGVDNLVRAINIDNANIGLFANGVGSATVEQVGITNSRGGGIALTGNLANGTFTFNNVDVTDAGGTLLAVTLGNSTVTFDGQSSLRQGRNAPLLEADGFHSGTINFLPGSQLAATDGDGLQFDSARGTYNFQGVTTLDGGDAGIDIFNNASGTFTFGTGTTINHGFPGLAAVDINGLLTGFEGTFNYDGSIASTGGSAPVSIAETSPGSTVNFNNSGANTITSTGDPGPGGLGEGITIFNADGTVNINTPTTLTNANFGITVDIDSAGDVTFTDTTINITDPATSSIPVVVGDHPGTIRFTNLNIVTNGNQDAAFFIGNTNLRVGTLIVDGDSNITTNGDGGIKLQQIDNIDVTFNNVRVTDPRSLPGATPPNAPVDAVRISDVTAGTFKVTNLESTGARSALSIGGSGADFTFEDITATNSAEQGVKIENYTGTFLLSDGDDNVDDDILTVDGTGAGFAGIDIANSGAATFTFANVDIKNTGAEGALLDDAGTVRFSGRSGNVGDEIGITLISGTNGDGINSTNTNLVVTFARIGETGQVLGDGIQITNNDGGTRTADLIFNNVFGLGVPDPTGRGVFIDAQSGTLFANLNANFFATGMSTIATQDGGAPRSLILDLTGNSTLSTLSAQPAISIIGSGLHSTVVRSWDFPNQVIGGITGSSGILFDRVTFDADGDPSNGIQQVVFSDGPMDDGALDIGQVPPFTIQRVEGDGLVFLNPTGNLRIDVLNIANQNGTGLIVDTKNLGTTFNLDIGGGTIDTVDGAAMFLDPLTGNLTFDVVTVDGSPTSGIIIDVMAGTLTVDSGSINNTTGAGVSLNGAAGFFLNNTAFTNIGGVTIDLTGSTVGGSGNTATPFSANDGGGNSGSILFNGGTHSAP